MYISEGLERKIWKIKDMFDTISYKWWRLTHRKQAKKYDEEIEAWFKKIRGEK